MIAGLACFMSATAAATCGVACEVPDLVPYWLLIAVDLINFPGASRSRFFARLVTECNESSGLTLPTEVALGRQAGAEIPEVKPLLPEAATTLIFAFAARPTASASAVLLALHEASVLKLPVPRLRDIAAML